MANNEIKILLIEDDPFLLNMYAAKFELENFNIIIADNGEKGLALAIKESPDVILLDIMLPNMDGFEVLQRIKSDSRLSKITVILLTNLSQKDDVDKGLNMRAEDYLIKAHFTPSEVVEKVKRVLKRDN